MLKHLDRKFIFCALYHAYASDWNYPSPLGLTLSWLPCNLPSRACFCLQFSLLCSFCLLLATYVWPSLVLPLQASRRTFNDIENSGMRNIIAQRLTESKVGVVFFFVCSVAFAVLRVFMLFRNWCLLHLDWWCVFFLSFYCACLVNSSTQLCRGWGDSRSCLCCSQGPEGWAKDMMLLVSFCCWVFSAFACLGKHLPSVSPL